MGLLRHLARDLALAALGLAGISVLYLAIYYVGWTMVRGLRF